MATPSNVQNRVRLGQDDMLLNTLITKIHEGNIEEVKGIILSDPSIINRRNTDGYTPLIIAVIALKRDIVNYLLINGADVNVTIHSGDYKGLTALHMAILANNINITEDLLKLNTVFMMNGSNIRENHLSKSRNEWRKEMIEFINRHVKDPALIHDFIFAINIAVRSRDLLQGPATTITKANLNRLREFVSKKFPRPKGGSTQLKRTPRRRKVVQTRKKRY
jgi:ankyrin repeat protein